MVDAMNWLQKLHRWLRRHGTPRVIITDGDHRFHAYVTPKDSWLYARTTRGMEELVLPIIHKNGVIKGTIEGRPGATWQWESDDDN